MKKIALSILIFTCPIFGMKELVTYKTSEAKNASVYHDGNEFKVLENNVVTEIERHRLDKQLQGINKVELQALLNHSYLTLGKSNDNNYSLKSNARFKGGNDTLGAIFYGVTYVVCHGAQLFMAKKAMKIVGATKDSCKVSNPKTGTEHVITNNGDGTFTDHSRKLVVDCSGTPLMIQPTPSLYDVPTNVVMAQAMSRPGNSGFAAAGVTMLENAPKNVQDAALEATIAVNVVAGAQTMTWIDRAANAAYQLGKSIPGKL